MAILKIRDAQGNVQEVLAIKGSDYVLTEADKREIAEMAAEMVAGMVVETVGSEVPSGEEVSY